MGNVVYVGGYGFFRVWFMLGGSWWGKTVFNYWEYGVLGVCSGYGGWLGDTTVDGQNPALLEVP